MNALILIPVLLAAVQVHPLDELSPGPAVRQWEISSAVLKGDLADTMCSPGGRQPGDPEVLVSYRQGGHHVMSCPVSTLGTAACNGTITATELPFPQDPCVTQTGTFNRYPETGWPSGDNVMVRLRDGRIVQIVQTYKLNCPPQFPTACTGADKEQIVYVIRTTDDCGQTWTPSALDAREITDLSGAPLVPPLVNFDRVEAYADPWSDHILLTATTAAEDPATACQCGCTQEAAFLHASTAGGVKQFQWQRLFSQPGTRSPNTPMTSIAHGGSSRVYWFNCTGWHPTLHVADDPWNQGGAPPIAIQLDLHLAGNDPSQTAPWECMLLPSSRKLCDPGSTDPSCQDPGTVMGGGIHWECRVCAPGDTDADCCPAGTPASSEVLNRILSLAIARVSTDGVSDVVRVVYPQVEFADGKPYQTARMMDFRISPDGAGGFIPALEQDRTLRATSNRDPADRASVFWANVIQADESTPDDPDATTHLVKWTEIGDSGTNREVVVAWDPMNLWSAERQLDTWACHGECSIGDYQYGAPIDNPDDCTHRFFAPWGEQKYPAIGSLVRTHGAIVTTSTDELQPTLDPAPPDATVECSEIPDPPSLGATDNCDPDPEVVYDEPFELPGNCEQNYTVTRRWTASDNAGRVTAVSQILTVQDTTSPLLDPPPADRIVECDAVPQPAELDVTDACDPDPTSGFTEDRVDGSCPSDYDLERTWTAEDACRNRSSANQTVAVRDTTAPVAAPGADDLYCLWPPNHDYVCFEREAFAPTIADNCAASTTWAFAGCASDQPDDAAGDGHTLHDCVVSSDGSAFCVRAERAGAVETGRRYSVTVVAADECGNTGVPTVIGHVHVPHDLGPGDPCIDAAERSCGRSDPSLCLQSN